MIMIYYDLFLHLILWGGGMIKKHHLQMEIVEDALAALGADLRVNAAEEGKVENALAEAIETPGDGDLGAAGI